jgi:hypothetical protein
MVVIGTKLCIGSIDTTLLDLPPDVLRWKLRTRENGISTIFLRYANCTEQWVLGPCADGKIRPVVHQATNAQSGIGRERKLFKRRVYPGNWAKEVYG